MKRIIPFAILIIAVLSIKCFSNKEINTDYKYKVIKLPESGGDTLKASYFADTVVYIPLETTTESLVDNIIQIWMNDSIILVSCFKAGLLQFQKNGEFLRKIGESGRGPGEYRYILNFDVLHDTIYVYSGRKSIMRYTIEGAFCDEIKLKWQPQYFSFTPDQKIACYARAEGKIFVYNKSFSTPDTIIAEYGVDTRNRYRYGYGDYSFMTYLQKTPSGLLFNNYLNDTVWNVTSDKKEPSFILDMKDKLLPWDKQIEFCNGNMEGWEEMAKNYNMVHLIPFTSWMFIFQKHYYGKEFDAIYLNNTKTDEIKRFNTAYIYDDIVGKQNLTVWTSFRSSDYLVAYLDSQDKSDDFKHNEGMGKSKPSITWLNQMNTVKEYDNPVLAIMKIN